MMYAKNPVDIHQSALISIMKLISLIIVLVSLVNGQSEGPNYPHARTNSSSIDRTSEEIILLTPLTSTVDKMTYILSSIESEKHHCTPGTDIALPQKSLEYFAKQFSAEAQVAWNRANLLTRLWKYSPEMFFTTDPVLKNQTESFLHTAVRTMVESNINIYAAGNCYDWYRYPGYDTFCPFASRMPDSPEVTSKDLARTYEYRATNEGQYEWFYQPKQKGLRAISRWVSARNATGNGTNRFQAPNDTEDTLLVSYEDGHWSSPYFDCGGGNIWMMTYTVPFFGFNWTTQEYHFMGTSGVDIDLRRMDINQCPTKADSADPNLFAGSAKCKPTTQCEPISGFGFSRGSYKCVCSDGYYFPDKSAYMDGRNYFNGTIIEQEYEKFIQVGKTGIPFILRVKDATYKWFYAPRQGGALWVYNMSSSHAIGFECLPCPEGCTPGCKDGVMRCGA